MMRLCKCGAIVKGRCPTCSKQPRQGKTAERGYDNRWTELSKRKRANDPLCERCLGEGKVTAASEVHHIEKIADRPDLRLAWDNLMSVCHECHKVLDGAGYATMAAQTGGVDNVPT